MAVPLEAWHHVPRTPVAHRFRGLGTAYLVPNLHFTDEETEAGRERQQKTQVSQVEGGFSKVGPVGFPAPYLSIA